MKIAILYSGNFRTFNDCFENHFEFFKDLSDDIDVYFSTWENISYKKHLNPNRHYYSKNKFSEDKIVDNELIKNVINDRFNLKKIEIEKIEDVKFKNFNLKSKMSAGLLYQYYKIKKCFSMVEENYDFLFRLRTDIVLNKKIEISELEKVAEKGKIIFNKVVWANTFFNENLGMINEMFWGSNFYNMEKSCKIYDNYNSIEESIFNGDDDPRGVSVFGEKVCYENLKIENIHKKITTYDFDYNVLR